MALHLDVLPSDVLLQICSHLIERDLCSLAQTCRRLNEAANHPDRWRELYQDVYEYDLPLLNPSPGSYQFVPLDDRRFVHHTDRDPITDLVGEPLWKTSFRQLYHAVHVRKHYKTHPHGRQVDVVDSIRVGLMLARRSFDDRDAQPATAGRWPLMFIHRGTYEDDRFVVQHEIAVLGAARGPKERICESVVMQRMRTTTICWSGSDHSYVAYVTFRNILLELGGACRSVLEYCRMQMPDVQEIRMLWRPWLATLSVHENAAPRIQHCEFTDCACMPLFLTDDATGTYRHNRIHGNRVCGVRITGNASGHWEDNEVYNNRECGFSIFHTAPTLIRNYIHHNTTDGIEVNTVLDIINNDGPAANTPRYHQRLPQHSDANEQALLRNNRIEHNGGNGIRVGVRSAAQIEDNDIGHNKWGVHCKDSTPTLSHNRIYENASAGILITHFADVLVHNNLVVRNLNDGVRVKRTAQARLDNNRWYHNKHNVRLGPGVRAPQTDNMTVP